MRWARKFRLSLVEDVFIVLTAAAIVVILVVSTVNVVGRYFFSAPFPGAIEIPTMMLLVVTFFSISGAQRMDLHIGLDAVLEVANRKAPRGYHLLQIVNVGVFFLVMAVIAYYMVPEAMQSRAMFEETSGPVFLPIWPFKLCIAAGSLLACARTLVQLFEHIRMLIGGMPRLEARGDQNG